MAHYSINQYLQQLSNVINNKDGLKAGDLLGFRHPHVASRNLQLEHPESHCSAFFKQPWDEVVAAHLRCCWAVSNHDFIEAYGCQVALAQSFLKLLQMQKEENWAVPIMFSIVLDLRIFAINAENQVRQHTKTKSGELLEKAADTLMSFFRVCASDNRAAMEDSKKWGMLYLINQLFKIYFKINKLHLCKPLIRAFDALPIKDQFGVAQLVTYKYYVGKKFMFDNDFKSAEEYLTFAFQHCHRQSRKNKRLILICLIPVKMLLGHMPTETLLRKHDLLQFADVARSVSTGNLLLLRQSMERHEAFFVRCGIFLILEKLKTITYRCLFKKAAAVLKTHQLSISSFTALLHWLGEEDVDDDEVECIVANLIYENKIKGYISHAHRKLVVSKQNAFPPLSTVI